MKFLKSITFFGKLKILKKLAHKKRVTIIPEKADLVPKTFNPKEIPFSKLQNNK